MGFINSLYDSRSHVWSLRGFILLQFIAILYLGHGLSRAPDALRVHIPPDLSQGAILEVDEPLEVTLYSFATYVFQQLNRWETNGETEYGERIYQLSPYFTPAFRQHLVDDLEKKSRGGELNNRSRALAVVPGLGFEPDRVKVLSNGVWEVEVYFRLIEDVYELNVKDTVIRYPMRIVRYPVDPEKNPWGLAIDVNPGVYPQRVNETELNQLRVTNTTGE